MGGISAGALIAEYEGVKNEIVRMKQSLGEAQTDFQLKESKVLRVLKQHGPLDIGGMTYAIEDMEGYFRITQTITKSAYSIIIDETPAAQPSSPQAP